MLAKRRLNMNCICLIQLSACPRMANPAQNAKNRKGVAFKALTCGSSARKKTFMSSMGISGNSMMSEWLKVSPEAESSAIHSGTTANSCRRGRCPLEPRLVEVCKISVTFNGSLRMEYYKFRIFRESSLTSAFIGGSGLKFSVWAAKGFAVSSGA